MADGEVKEGQVNLEQVEIGDYAINVRADKKEGDSCIARDIIEQDSYQVKKIIGRYPELIDRQLTVIDIGGHIGSFGVLIMSLLKNAKLLAFEPLPEAASVYRQNLHEYISSGRAVIYDKAVSYSYDSLTLLNSWDPNYFTGNVAAYPPEKLRGNAHIYGPPVETVTVENALRESGYESSAYLIKMDCEEGEWDILPNLSPEIASKTIMVLGEWHSPDWRRIIAESEKCFPHLHTSTHVGWGCGNFWSISGANGEQRERERERERERAQTMGQPGETISPSI